MEDKLSIDEPSIEIKILKSIPDYHFVCQSGNTVILLVLFKKKTGICIFNDLSSSHCFRPCALQ